LISAILLAAGESTRMGRPKPLLPWDGKTLVEWQIEQLLDAGVDGVVVVLGFAADEVRAAVRHPRARVVVNEAYREGRASSLRCGAAAVADDVEAVVVLGADQLRAAWVTRRLLDAWRRSRRAVALPRYGDHRGHPVVLAGRLLPELRVATEEEQGLRAVLQRHAAETEVVPIDSAVVDLDLNTPADYERALAAFDRGEWSEPSPS
jgi:molybdenum cofactor cytidylyltransferase